MYQVQSRCRVEGLYTFSCLCQNEVLVHRRGVHVTVEIVWKIIRVDKRDNSGAITVVKRRDITWIFWISCLTVLAACYTFSRLEIQANSRQLANVFSVVVAETPELHYAHEKKNANSAARRPESWYCLPRHDYKESYVHMAIYIS